MWTLESGWFDVAAFSTLSVVLTVVFGRFEQHKPAWRRLAKLAVLMVLLLVLVETVGRGWAYGILGLLLAAGTAVHFVVLSNLGINGWTGEPRDKFEALLREIADHGEIRTLYSLGRRPRS
jgi:drug/metabolite transporter (DMT)-like permease